MTALRAPGGPGGAGAAGPAEGGPGSRHQDQALRAAQAAGGGAAGGGGAAAAVQLRQQEQVGAEAHLRDGEAGAERAGEPAGAARTEAGRPGEDPAGVAGGGSGPVLVDDLAVWGVGVFVCV